MLRAILSLCLFVSIASDAHSQSGTARRIDDWGIISLQPGSGEAVALRLSGVHLPRPDAPGHGIAMDALNTSLAQAGTVTLLPLEGSVDRFGHLLADLEIGNTTLATELVRDGYAMAYSWRGETQRAEQFLRLEDEARTAGRGLWGTGDFAIRGAEPNRLALDLETVQIVEGRVISVGDMTDRVYLNFGFDYRTDFTVSVAREHIQEFAELGLDLTSLEGRIVRVRGWLQAINGPSMSLDHPERIEVLTPIVAAD